MKNSFKSIVALFLCVVMLSMTVLTSCNRGDSGGNDEEPLQSEQSDHMNNESAEGEECESSSNQNGQGSTHTHVFGDWSVTTKPTCIAKGEESRACACGKSETRDLAQLLHKPAYHPPVDANCNESGNVAYWSCEKCEAYFSDEDCTAEIVDKTSVLLGTTGCVYNTDNICTVCNTALQYTEGLAYTLNSDGNSYTVKKGTVGNATEIVIPYYYAGKPVTSIDGRAFSYCSGLTTIKIPASVTSIGDYAFYDCAGLTSITIPDSVTSIGDSAFNNCTGLTSITIPDSVTSIGEWAFYSCDNLTTVNFAENSQLTSIGSYAFCLCDNLTTVNFAENSQLTSIGDHAFEFCSSMTSVTIPDSVTSIGEWAFEYCSSLTSVTIPASVTSIGKGAFNSCDNLTTVNFAENSQLTSIGDYAFEYCSSLTSATIPASVTSISYSAFYRCTELSSITVEKGNTKYHSVGNCLIETESKTLILGCKNSVIPNDGTVTSIGSYAFYGCDGLTSITIPDSVTSIGDYAFQSCVSLTMVNFAPNSQLTSVGEKAFEYCVSLVSITIPKGVTSIAQNAFYRCFDLVEIYNLSSANTDGTYLTEYAKCIHTDGNEASHLFTDEDGFVFYKNDSELYLIGYIGGETELTLPTSFCGNNYEMYEHAFRERNITSVVIPESLTAISEYAFIYCDDLTSITIPASVTSIGQFAFNNCSNLTEVYITDLAAWCNIEFDSAASNPLCCANKLYVNGNLITTLEIPSSVTAIKDYAFCYFDGFESITIHGSVTSISSLAFYGCTELSSITVEKGNTKYHSAGNCLIETESKTLILGCKNSVIPNDGTVTSIGDHAFYGCAGLTSITIPDGVTSIGSDAFYDCDGLTSITIPAGVTSIGSDAFYDCDGLTSITIPAGVTSIGSDAFYSCGKLASIKYRGTEEQWNAITKGYNWDKNTGSYTITYNYTGE